VARKIININLEKMNYKKQDNCLETNDIALVTTVCYFGGQIEEIDKTNPKRAKFIIKRSNFLDNVVRDYWSHSLQVEPSAFLNNLKEIKSRLYQKID
jgi:hypothetical protein